MRLRPLALTLLMVCSGCAVPEAAATGPTPSPHGQGGGSGAGTQDDAGPPACACFFENWSLIMECGTRCIGDSKLSCSATVASVDPSGCAVPGPDGGPAADAGPDADGGINPGDGFDAGVSTCTPISSVCGCTIAPYETPTFRVTIPCCTTICFASQHDRAWSCSEKGVTELIGVPAVCGGK